MRIRKKEDDQYKKRIEELENNWKRAVADYRNLETRCALEKKDWVNFSTSQLLVKLIPAMENLEKASVHLHDKGLELVVKQVKDVLQSENLEEIKIQSGDKYDAQVMECVEAAQGPEGKVLKVVEKGYRLAGRLLKPARVIVGK